MIRVELKGRDLIEYVCDEDTKRESLNVIGCAELMQLIQRYQENGQPVAQWELPMGKSHSEVLVRELISKVRGVWNFPYPHDELCHCRAVQTETVDQAIIAGAHTASAISRVTSASTACGNCRFDIEAILQYRLQDGCQIHKTN
ncbi:MAG: hypothetical protein BroJett040_11680 [Oligoflexia bacterium]|nr:MAG: hypothetical protein BroJett040_11680 [Oligoflexia bacterium]